MCWKRVIRIEDFYDRPRGGVAFLEGKPHSYQSLWSDAEDDYSDENSLMLIDEALLPLMEEKWSIWVRWETAFHRDETSRDAHPALSAERQCYDELKALLDPLPAVDPEKSRRLLAEFRNVVGGWNGLEVRWASPKVSKSSARAAKSSRQHIRD